MKAGLIEYWLEELLVAASKEGKQGDKGSIQQVSFLHGHFFLAPTGALVLMMVYYISIRAADSAAATFSDFEHLCLSILLQVSL